MFNRYQKNIFLFQHIRFSSSLSSGRGYAHLLNNNNDSKKYAISFLSSQQLGNNKIIDYPEFIIGWTANKDKLDPKTFSSNNQFIDFMTKAFSQHIHEVNDTTLKGMAQWQKEGWLHVGDERNPAPWGRIPKPEDIIGSVLLQDGKIQPGTYQAMPAYRLVTNKGLMQLSEPLEQCLVKLAKQKLK